MTTYTLEIQQDPDPENPRDWNCNLAKMLCIHRRYALGDKLNIKLDDFTSWDDIIGYLVKKEKAIVTLPLYLYDHSGIAISLTPFSCPWDSGQVGLAYIDKETALKEYPGDPKYTTTAIKLWAVEQIADEVKTYDQYLQGDVWGWVIKDETGTLIDCCWGFYDKDTCAITGWDELDRLNRRAQRELRTI